MYNVDTTLLRFHFCSDLRHSSFLQVRRTAIKGWMSSNFRKIHSRTAELPALERLKNLQRLTIIFGRNVVTTLAPSI